MMFLHGHDSDEAHADPARWYSVARARMMPTTFIIKARMPGWQMPDAT
jgi:hypothetical protein